MKIRKVLAYIIPFIVFGIITFFIEFIIKLMFADLYSAKMVIFDVIITVIACVAYLISGYYIEPNNKIKTSRILSFIMIFCWGLIWFGSYKEFEWVIISVTGIVTILITYLSIEYLNKISNNK